MARQAGTGSTGGRLEVIATPIGNLSDLSSRARDSLASADVVAAEDTRRTGQLLTALGLQKPLISLHAHNERERSPALLQRLAAGEHQVAAGVGDGPGGGSARRGAGGRGTAGEALGATGGFRCGRSWNHRAAATGPSCGAAGGIAAGGITAADQLLGTRGAAGLRDGCAAGAGIGRRSNTAGARAVTTS